MTELELGAHLVSPRSGYTHHGIYVGDDSVIHYSGLATGFRGGPIEKTTLAEFSQERDISIRSYRNPKYISSEAVARSQSRLGESSYDVQGNNCEHFCTWVIMGVSESSQVEKFEDFIDIFAPRITALAKIRKHRKQRSNAGQIGSDVAEIVVKTAASATMTPVIPVIVSLKAFKWWRKRDP